MIPVSSSNYQQGCNPISSNCVVWQGPDLPVIGLCNGDTISDVIAKLAAKLVEIQDAVSIAGVDLSCLELSTAPTSVEELFQVIVDEICTLKDGSGTTGGTTTTETVIATLPVCLQYTNLENDLVTQLPIDEYAELVAAKVCDIITDVTTLQTQVADHETRIITLEGASGGSNYTTPQITPSCVLPAVATDIDVVIDELEDQFCTLNSALGGSTELLSASGSQCDSLNGADQLSGSGAMSGLPGWNTTVTSVADSLQNMWLTICDMRSAIKTIQDTCCSLSCSDVIFAVSGSFTGGTLTLDFTGTSIPSAMSECDINGADVTISDGTNTYNTEVSVLTALSGDNTATVDLSSTLLDQYLDYTVTITLCVTDGSITCNKEKTITVTNPDEEPAPTINYYVFQECTTPTTTITASYSGGTMNVGEAAKLSHDGGAVCWTVVDIATGSATSTVLQTYADCTACNT